MIPLLILGLLKQNPGSHGYELLALMEERHYKYVVSFTKGSFYYNLQKLEEKEYIKRIGQSDNTRETHNYIITELGNKEFENLMYKYGSKTEYVNLSFYSAMLFTDEYKIDEMKKLIQIQIEQTNNKILLLEKSLREDNTIPTYFRKMMENSRSHHLVNVQWFKELLESL
ncbi:MAG: PadR family transcriptional regulator [Paraclostridium sordellii]|uniref:PadR family transcriptional regulator n=1 Tax=Paraclostridium sordellii TaxID=1505 RepID=UPI000543B277|nr:helix-turn-helix transcriptional regulator [Paeniclostridium sordellii]MCQ4696767.1 PadR family transcriptional regulator [Paeniclostridium sordellii]MVO73977.1 PadR family transcriptional regulator [Paeniclostridium sordellii]CEK33906.1 PadR-like family transcriptional regulator,transcriptional regulator, Acidobacterial, PadR-family,Transcriptional regulator PadR-like family [[Clostridium] sordellii] [Paeniclostridium sordellii]CEN83713.1 PadR-like family transcriptional regulator [[Clostri